MPRISVLLPARNAEATLASALKTLRWQTFEDWEAVLVDDGSSDRTAEIMDQGEPRFRILKGEGKGLVEALNLGLRHCQAPWVARMDADDLSHPRRLEEQLRLAESEHLQVVSSKVRLFPRRDLGSGFGRYENWLNNQISHREILSEMFVESPLIHPSTLIARDWLNGYQDHGWAEDYDLWMRLRLKGARFGKVPRTLFWWREGQDRLTRTHQAYSSQSLRRLKIHYLRKVAPVEERPLVIWGAGRNGKRLARELIEAGLAPTAFSDLHPGRLGQQIHGAQVYHPDDLPLKREAFHLAAVGQPGGRKLVRTMMRALDLEEFEHFLCLS